ncbi:hypothetical protein [Lacrimispora sp.]|uniref:hypothetical protein n=1 Tax=Lacrimispora sp. TaxID=2719234 RepID=UPI0028B1185F|nr:hypothetical protein [Lacrimispora sp.]
MKRMTTVPQAALVKCSGCVEESNCYSDISCNEVFQGIKKLKAYEDTGLEPEDMHKANPFAEWGEEYGDCLWWSFPIEEPPYCGTPLDCDFPDYVTHFTRFSIPQLEFEGGVE